MGFELTSASFCMQNILIFYYGPASKILIKFESVRTLMRIATETGWFFFCGVEVENYLHITWETSAVKVALVDYR